MSLEEKYLAEEIERKFVDGIPYDYETSLYILTNNSYNLDCKMKARNDLLKEIEKQQKEIERLQKNNILLIENGEFTWKQKYEETYNYIKENYISKDKIKAKIEEVENMTLVEIAEKVEGHTYYLSLDGLSEGKKIASYFIQSLLEEKE